MDEERKVAMRCEANGCTNPATQAFSTLVGVCDYHAAAQSSEDWGAITRRMRMPKYVALREWFKGVDAIHADPKAWMLKGWDLEKASQYLIIRAEAAGIPKDIFERRLQTNPKTGEEALEPVEVQTYRLRQALISKIASEAAYERTGYALNVRKEDAQKYIDQALESILIGMKL